MGTENIHTQCGLEKKKKKKKAAIQKTFFKKLFSI
jgi:hypothetical protein